MQRLPISQLFVSAIDRAESGRRQKAAGSGLDSFLFELRLLLLLQLHKPDGSLLGLRRVHELSDGLDDLGDGLIVRGELAINARFQRLELLGQFLVGGAPSKREWCRSVGS